MSQDVRIGALPDYADTKTLEECQLLLEGFPVLKKVSERQWLYESDGRRMSIDLSHIDAEGDADGDAGCNALDTHVAWNDLRGRGAMWAYTQLRLRLAAVFGWRALDLQSGDIYSPLPPENAAPLYKLPDTAAKGTMPVHLIAWNEGTSAVRYRKKERLVAKSEPRASYSALVALDDDRLLHGHKGGSYISSVPGIQLRSGDALDCTDEQTGGGRILALRSDREALLSDGPLSQGRRAHVNLYRPYPPELLSAVPLPLSPPFAWVPEQKSFLAAVPRKDQSDRDFDEKSPCAVVDGSRLLISDQAVDGYPWLREALDPAAHHLIEVDYGERSWRPVISQEEFADAFGSYEGSAIDELAVSPDGRKLYGSDGYCTAACFDRAEERFVWKRHLHDSMRVYALALSPCGRYLAVGGLADDLHGPESFALLHAHTGEFVYRLPVCGTFRSAVYTAAWHPEGNHLLLGLANGTIVELSLDGEARYFQGLKGGIRALCFQGDRLFATGAEKAVRARSSLE